MVHHQNLFNVGQYFAQISNRAETLRQNLNSCSISIEKLKSTLPSEILVRMQDAIKKNVEKYKKSIVIVKRIANISIHQVDITTFQETRDLSIVEQNYKELISFRKKLESELSAHDINKGSLSFSEKDTENSKILRETHDVINRMPH
jgi:hypothetical protein